MTRNPIKHRCIFLAAMIVMLVANSNRVWSLQSVPTTPPLQAQLEREIDLRTGRLDKLSVDLRKLDETEDQLNRHLTVLEDQFKKIETNLSDTNLSAPAVPEVLTMLQTMRVQLLIDLGGLRARQLSLRKYRDETARHENRLQAKEIAVFQEQIRFAREDLKQIELLHQKGAGSNQAILAAKHKVNLAELQMLQLQNANGDSSNSELELVTALDLAEKEARLAEVESLLKSTLTDRELVEKAEYLREQRREVNNLQLGIEQQKRELEQDLGRISAELKALRTKLEHSMGDGE